jgi:multimeric flavodoxin WrbA
MKILVLGGSPKGEASVTMQYVRYLEKRFPEHGWEVRQIASRIALLERDGAALSDLADAVSRADLVLWAFPLYYLTVCSQYKRFIELVENRGLAPAFAGKYAGSLSTSIHFYDHTAHEYIRAVSEDWGLRFVASYSAAMDDLLKAAERDRLDAFAEDLFATAAAGLELPRRSAPLTRNGEPSPAEGLPPLPAPAAPAASLQPQNASGARVRAAVLADYPDSAAGRMADRAALSLPGADRVDLGTLGLEHGCLGCLKCGAGDCAYTGKDAFIDTFRRLSSEAEVLVFAGVVRDRYLSWLWKAFLDRSFFNTHRPAFEGKRVVVLMSGPLSQLAVLKEVLSAYFEMMGACLVDMVSDEAETSEVLAARIDAAVARAVRAAASGDALPPKTFRRIGGMKVFRDEIYGGLRIVFKGDHREYRRAGRYDFPLLNPIKRFGVWAAYWITSVPFIAKAMRANMAAFMLKPYAPVIERAVPKRGSSR